METQVQDVVRAALGHLRVTDMAGNVSAVEMVNAIRALNLLAREWEASGVTIGWSDVAKPEDPLPAPFAEAALGYNLAMRLRPRYGAPLDPDLIALAQETLATVSAQVTATAFERIEYPDLPSGTGQRCGNWRDGFFR